MNTMSDQIQTLTQDAQEQVNGYTTGVLSTLDSYNSQVSQWAVDLLDRFVTPEQRANILAKIQEFMLANPKLSVRTCGLLLATISNRL